MNSVQVKVMQDQMDKLDKNDPAKEEMQNQMNALIETQRKNMAELEQKIAAIVGGKEVLDQLGAPDLSEDQLTMLKPIKPKIQQSLDSLGDFDEEGDSVTLQKACDGLIEEILTLTKQSKDFAFDEETEQALTSLVKEVQQNEQNTAASVQEVVQKELNQVAKVLVENIAVTLQEYIRINMEEMEKNKSQPWRVGFIRLTVAVGDMIKQEVGIVYIRDEITTFSEQNEILEAVQSNINDLHDPTNIVGLLVLVNDACKTNYELKEAKRTQQEAIAHQRQEMSHGGFNRRIRNALEEAEKIGANCTNKSIKNSLKRDNLVVVFKDLMRASIAQGEDFQRLHLGENPKESEKDPGEEQDEFIDAKVIEFFGPLLTQKKITDREISSLTSDMRALNRARQHCDKTSNVKLHMDDNKKLIRYAGYGLLAAGVVGAAYYFRGPIQNLGTGLASGAKSTSMTYGPKAASWLGTAISASLTAAFVSITVKPIVAVSGYAQSSITSFFAKPRAIQQATPSLAEQVEQQQNVRKT